MNELNPHYNTHSSSPGEQPISTASNSDQVQSPLNAQDKGKGKKVIVDTSESDWNESSDEEENQGHNTGFEVAGSGKSSQVRGLGATWDSPAVARAKAIERSKLEPISFPVIGDVFTSANEMRLILASFALQNSFSATGRRGTENKPITISCSISNTRSIRGGRNSCQWGCRGNTLEDGTVQVYATHSKHNHTIGGKLAIQVKALNDSRGQGAKKYGSKFPTQAIIIANAQKLIKSSTRPILQDMNLTFATADEMRTHITSVAIVNSFAITLQNGAGTDIMFAMRCYLGKESAIVSPESCTYRFRSEWDKTRKRWIVIDSNLDHNHEMGLYEMIGKKSRITEKGMAMLKNLAKSNSSKRVRQRSEESMGEESEGEKLDNPTSSHLRSRIRSKEEQVPISKKAKITQIESTQSQSFASTSSLLPPLPQAIQTPPITPIPNPLLESSREWINTLTKVLTAIDPRLENLALVFDNAGVSDERAVMEMMHLSDDGLEQLASKMVKLGGGMTMMQKLYFKKGIANIRNRNVEI